MTSSLAQEDGCSDHVDRTAQARAHSAHSVAITVLAIYHQRSAIFFCVITVHASNLTQIK